MVNKKQATLYTCFYITNKCANDCCYCGYRRSNTMLDRITLTTEQIREEAKAVKKSGHANAILIGGSLPEEQYKGLILTAAKTLLEEGLNPWIEFENLSIKTLRELRKVGADHFILFQETYNKELYTKLHYNAAYKGDYESRLRKIDRAVEAGFTHIGIGVLFGLNKDYVSEVIGLIKHARHLLDKGVEVCIHIPRLKPAPGVSMVSQVSEEDLKKIASLIRLALPEVSIALTARESAEFRNRLFKVVDYIGCGGVPNPGGRTVYKEAYQKGDRQFTLSDKRSPQEVTEYLASIGIKVRHQAKRS